MGKKIHIDLLKNRKFGRISILGESESIRTSGGNSVRMVYCKCDCGIEKLIRLNAILHGSTVSCGCYNYDNIRQSSVHSIKHGMYKSREYNTWLSMKKRCLNKKHKSYFRYGGRGIKICDEWICSFENFYKDMGASPSKNHSLDRIDNNGNYCPQNCRWATKTEQSRNCSANIVFYYNGREMCLSEISKISNVPYARLHYRLRVANMSIEEAISFKSDRTNRFERKQNR